MECLVDIQENLICWPMFHWEPMQLHQYRCYVLSFACPSDQSRCCVLYTLEMCKLHIFYPARSCASYPILICPAPASPALFCPALTYPTLPCPAPPCPTLPCPTLGPAPPCPPCPTLPDYARLCPALPHPAQPAQPCPTLPCPAHPALPTLPCPALPHPALSWPVPVSILLYFLLFCPVLFPFSSMLAFFHLFIALVHPCFTAILSLCHNWYSESSATG